MPERPRQYETGLTLAMSMLVLLFICEHFLRWSLNKWYRGQSCQKQLWKKCSRFPMTYIQAKHSTVIKNGVNINTMLLLSVLFKFCQLSQLISFSGIQPKIPHCIWLCLFSLLQYRTVFLCLSWPWCFIGRLFRRAHSNFPFFLFITALSDRDKPGSYCLHYIYLLAHLGIHMR